MDNVTFSTIGALIGLALSIFLIIKNFHATYALIIGALVGGLIGGGGLVGTVSAMVKGSESMMSSVLTCAPIALAVGKKSNLSKSSILLAMIGGGKAGNVISPNPNTIATAEGFKLNLTSLMYVNIIPAICALIVTIIIAMALAKKKTDVIDSSDLESSERTNLPSFFASIIGPVTVIVLLALRPLAKITIDPLIALPLGGFVCLLATKETKNTKEYVNYGFSKIIGVCALLIGTGTIAGIIKNSTLQTDMINLISAFNLPAFILAPVAGILMQM